MVTRHDQFTKMAALWAQRSGLPVGNLWEPALVRYMEREYERLGGDKQAMAFIIALTANQLNFSDAEKARVF